MSTDAELLRRYVEEKSEAAFAELVRLHLDLVYFAALRQVGGDAHRAKDVAQTVFTDLARKAASLTNRATLTGWLHTSTRFAAAKVRRADFSRQQHEQEASTMNALLQPDPAAEWERLRPMIDDAIHELDERDREAVLLRYFENRPFADIGAALRLSEDAARMRVDRALEKLRAALVRRGVKSTSAALAAVFANQVGATAPVGLATSITSVALANVGGVAAAVGAGIFMSNTSTAIVSVVALAAIGATFLQWNHAQRAETELAALALERDSLRSQLATEQQRAKRVGQEVTALQIEVDSLKTKQATMVVVPSKPTPRSAEAPAMTDEEIRRASVKQAVLNNLRQTAAARDAFQQKFGRPPASLDELVGEGKFIRALVPVDGENYATLSLVHGAPLIATTSDGTMIKYDQPSTYEPPTPAEAQANELRRRMTPAIQTAVENYSAAHNGNKPPTPQDLLPYFATPQAGADFAEYLEAQKAAFLEKQKAGGK